MFAAYVFFTGAFGNLKSGQKNNIIIILFVFRSFIYVSYTLPNSFYSNGGVSTPFFTAIIKTLLKKQVLSVNRCVSIILMFLFRYLEEKYIKCNHPALLHP